MMASYTVNIQQHNETIPIQLYTRFIDNHLKNNWKMTLKELTITKMFNKMISHSEISSTAEHFTVMDCKKCKRCDELGYYQTNYV